MAMNRYKKYRKVAGKIVILGFGSIGQALFPLLARHLVLQPQQVRVVSKLAEEETIAQELGVNFRLLEVTRENYKSFFDEELSSGDFLINLSTGISSADLIRLCQAKKVLYLDASTEPWEGYYTDESLSPSQRTNYALREEMLAMKGKRGSTAVITHGANPGLVSHFVKQALWNMARDNDLPLRPLQTAQDWAHLAHQLTIKAIHIAERDTQITSTPKMPGEFVNTWSVPGFMAEARQPAELSWGTHERHWPKDAHHYDFGSNCSIYLDRPGATTQVRTWTPTLGPFHGFLITHAESISIADYLSIRCNGHVIYRPTVHYAYFPCPDATLSLHEYNGMEWQNGMNQEEHNRLIVDDIIDGMDELGVLLMGNKKGAYWFGSQLSIHDARKQVPYNNATSLQVAAGVLAALLWAMEYPECGIVEPEDLDYQYILKIALPYLGNVSGYYTNWNPLKDRQQLYSEKIDRSDPWQFLNIRVN
ncbi:homospermidine synthase [Legionella taurinensis]|nr:saccharopine dehydrogenase C-terminal domain-containing protein [Legionella taurinensis]MDX1838784.1 saccharopine dehydrogenase NADP-binding domain-containing protein [Legionella taurinensis]STY27195.1 homospermidine synthase [Legionella taurinensis]